MNKIVDPHGPLLLPGTPLLFSIDSLHKWVLKSSGVPGSAGPLLGSSIREFLWWLLLD